MFEGAIEILAAVSGIGAALPGERVVGIGVRAAVFEKPDFVAELVKAEEIVEVVPGHATEGIGDDVAADHNSHEWETRNQKSE